MTHQKAQLEELKKQLEDERASLEQELQSFAAKNPQVKGDWRAIYPDLGSSAGQTDESEDEVEAYDATLPVEQALETKLNQVKQALARMTDGNYGNCQQCGQPIALARLKASPTATNCQDCV